MITQREPDGMVTVTPLDNVTGPVLIALDPLVMVTLDVTVCVFSYIGTEGAKV
jgi:hypothetical protein